MNPPVIPEALAIIAGKGAYPCELARSARAQGVKRLYALAFKGETDRALARLVDEIEWIHVGQLGALLANLQRSGAKVAVMAGQITPTNLFRVRMDRPMIALLSRLRERNADTIFGAVGEELGNVGLNLQPASLFMESAMPAPGLIAQRTPTPEEMTDIQLGLRVARATSGLDIGQTVVIKRGTVLAVEAFEGTDAAIRRAGELGGKGAVVIKVAKRGHDMRFDIPVVGLHTLVTLRKAGVTALAVEAGRTILLEREQLVVEANRQGLCFLAVASETTTEKD
jgi:DUF1009 family protein